MLDINSISTCYFKTKQDIPSPMLDQLNRSYMAIFDEFSIIQGKKAVEIELRINGWIKKAEKRTTST